LIRSADQLGAAKLGLYNRELAMSNDVEKNVQNEKNTFFRNSGPGPLNLLGAVWPNSLNSPESGNGCS